METISIIISGLTLIALIIGFGDKIFNRASKEQKVVDRVAKLEESNTEMNKCIGAVGEDIKKIKENHLAHIQADINAINVNLSAINTTLDFLKEK